jgi:hypothetical protein
MIARNRCSPSLKYATKIAGQLKDQVKAGLRILHNLLPHDFKNKHASPWFFPSRWVGGNAP